MGLGSKLDIVVQELVLSVPANGVDMKAVSRAL